MTFLIESAAKHLSIPRGARAVATILIAAAIGGALPGPSLAAVTLKAVPPSPRWPAAAEDGALSLACGSSPAEVEEFFLGEGLPFRRGLVREGTEACHVLYRPTVPGFRASPDDEPLRGILFAADALAYLATARSNRGEALGAMGEVLRRVERPLEVGVILHHVHPTEAYEKATARGFGETPHRVTLRERGVDRNFWWVQDYVKAGRAGGEGTMLVPRRLFEGDSGNADVYDPLLERICEEKGVVRSRLSWEGGDLQFTRDPRDPSRLLLFYGSFVKPYWGESLSDAEFEYVLSLEFGADQAVDLGGLAPHVDYFVSFLPRARTALVSVPRSGDLDLARAVVERLLLRFVGREPRTLVDLREALSSPNPSPPEIARLVEQARGEQGGWSFDVDEELFEETKALVAEVCPGRQDCFSAEDQVRLAEADPALFEDWIHAVQHARDEQSIITAHLDLLQSQIEVIPAELEARTVEKIAELEGLGFQVVEVPAYRVNLRNERAWPGISYVNALVIDEQVFVPRFGLGEAEDGIFRLVQARLPPGYTIVPVDAQRVLIRNGGLHCLAGLVR